MPERAGGPGGRDADEDRPAPKAAEAKATEPAPAAAAAAPVQAERKKPAELSRAVVDDALSSADFGAFFDRAARILSRALHEGYDVTTDYAADEAEDAGESGKTENVRKAMEFFNERWSTGRAVTSLDWSRESPELLCAAYNASLDNVADVDGIVMIWNTHSPDRAEYKFECQSAVLSAAFTPFNKHIVVGGTYSGQIVLWDNRAKHTPVQRSAINAKAHTHPVYSLEIVGTQNAHTLITVSTDGKLCSWTLDMLTAPLDALELQAGASKPVAATCVSFPLNENDKFVCGSEEGVLYQGCRHGGKGIGTAFEERAGDAAAAEPSHYGPITAVDFNKASGDFSHLFLSASTDWTVKLWSYRNTSRCLYKFDNASDYVFDAAWSPVHPSLFAVGDGMGYLDLWNITADTELPVVHEAVGDGKQAINRVKWTHDGRHIAAADASGRISLYTVNERLAVPRPDEPTRLKQTLADMQAAHDDKAR